MNAQITDGGFEGGEGGGAWVEASVNFSSLICSVSTCEDFGGVYVPNSGTYYVWFGGISSPETASVQQSANIPVGTTASLHMMVKIAATGQGDASEKMEISVDGTILETITVMTKNFSNCLQTLDIIESYKFPKAFGVG